MAAGSSVTESIVRVFQRHGYEGASLSSLSEETGLIKASLYHRFPEGKQQMAHAALNAVAERFGRDILEPLGQDIPLDSRLAAVIAKLRRFYEDGHNSCLLDTLSLRGTPESVTKIAQSTARAWVMAFARLARDGGMRPAEAKVAAEDAIGQIEGSLILARLTGSAAPFKRAMKRLRPILLPKLTRIAEQKSQP